jgi:hypothetical protein
MEFDDVTVGKRLFVGEGSPEALGKGEKEARGSAYIEGPMIVGQPEGFPKNWATLMVGPNKNSEADDPRILGNMCTGNNSPYSLAVQGNLAVFDIIDAAQDINAGKDIVAQGEVKSRCGTHILSAKKNFDIPHPTKQGWRLRHTCPEGPYNDVYVRGRVSNKNVIELPHYWEKLVDPRTITVSLTPIGAHQDIIIKRISENKIHLQAKGGMPIDCFYHVFGERMDGEPLISEYQGESPADYPGNNDQYSIAGYHYDVKN